MDNNNLIIKLRDLFFYCGVSKEKYREIKPEAYRSNFITWKYLHLMIAVCFAGLFFFGLFSPYAHEHIMIYAGVAIYMGAVWFLFRYVLSESSIIAQLVIYLTIIMLLTFGMYQALSMPNSMAVSFIVLLVVQSMFMIDKPYFMAIEISLAVLIYLMHAYAVKTPEVFRRDLYNTLVFGFIAIIINIFYNTLRVREFILNKELLRQRDTDGLTGLYNRKAVATAIDESLSKRETSAMMTVDIDRFKEINDNYGHDVGDAVLCALADYMLGTFTDQNIAGRFGGDEFVVFLRGYEHVRHAGLFAQALIDHVNRNIHTPDANEQIGVCVGIAVSSPYEKNFDSLFKKTDLALYKAKAGGRNCFVFYEEEQAKGA